MIQSVSVSAACLKLKLTSLGVRLIFRLCHRRLVRFRVRKSRSRWSQRICSREEASEFAPESFEISKRKGQPQKDHQCVAHQCRACWQLQQKKLPQNGVSWVRRKILLHMLAHKALTFREYERDESHAVSVQVQLEGPHCCRFC